jgi:hypothetical protein
MKKLLSIVVGLLVLSGCGDDCENRVIQFPPQVVVQQPNVPTYPQQTNNFVVVQRGYYAGCRGYVTNVYYGYVYGRLFNVSPLVCNGRVFYNVQLPENVF